MRNSFVKNSIQGALFSCALMSLCFADSVEADVQCEMTDEFGIVWNMSIAGGGTVTGTVDNAYPSGSISGIYDPPSINLTATNLAPDDCEIFTDSFTYVGTCPDSLNCSGTGQGFCSGSVVISGSWSGSFTEPCILDSDGDGVSDDLDICPNTVLPESVPTKWLGFLRWALVDDDGDFDTAFQSKVDPYAGFTIEDTGGCSCEQIASYLHLPRFNKRFGCNIVSMKFWVDYVVTHHSVQEAIAAEAAEEAIYTESTGNPIFAPVD